MTEWLVYRGRGGAGLLARRAPRPAPDAGLAALPEPAAEPGDSAAAGIVAG
ncbi:MAG TPA: hypothetical protein VIF35_12625 [Streptosporangiaceae bacterium]|jgi:hypothetical protein